MTIDPASPMIERLKAYQGRALDVADRAEAILVLNDPAQAPAMAQTRWEMLRALMPYSAFKHSELFPAMLASGRPEHIAEASRLRAECLKLGEDLKVYVARWSSVSVPDHWAEYRPAAIALLARLRTHMNRELRAAESMLPKSMDRRVPHGTAIAR